MAQGGYQAGEPEMKTDIFTVISQPQTAGILTWSGLKEV